MRVLETDRLVLRPFAEGDLEQIATWFEGLMKQQERNATASKFLDHCFREYQRRGIGPWAMVLKVSSEVVGHCGFPHLDERRRIGEVNYMVADPYRRRGLATETVRALLQFGFEDLQLNRIQARCQLENLASERVMQKVGMTFEHRASAVSGAPEKMYVSIRPRLASRYFT